MRKHPLDYTTRKITARLNRVSDRIAEKLSSSEPYGGRKYSKEEITWALNQPLDYDALEQEFGYEGMIILSELKMGR